MEVDDAQLRMIGGSVCRGKMSTTDWENETSG